MWNHGPPHVMLGIKPPRPPGTTMTEQSPIWGPMSGRGFASSAPERPLVPKYLNLPVPRGSRFQHLEPPWGEAVPKELADGLTRRWPTGAR